MKEYNKNLKEDLKMKNVNKNKPSYQEMCEDLKKLSLLMNDRDMQIFIKKVQDAQSSATTIGPSD